MAKGGAYVKAKDGGRMLGNEWRKGSAYVKEEAMYVKEQ